MAMPSRLVANTLLEHRMNFAVIIDLCVQRGKADPLSLKGKTSIFS